MRSKFGVLVVVSLLLQCAGVVGHAQGSPVVDRIRGGDRTVSLITGDRVVLAGGDLDRSRIVPGPGRRHVTFSTHRVDGSLVVIPSDVSTRVASGRLDPRLFDIGGLIEAGYDDGRSRSLPLIVTYAGRAGRVSMARSGAETVRELPSIDGAAVRVAKGRGLLTTLAGVERIWLDGKRQITLDESVPQIGAPSAWQAGLTGKGVTVAVLDSGIDATHPDLAGRVAEARNFTEAPAGDDVGHGTHVASTIAGTNGKYRGVAPDATLLDGKVCNADGCAESAILAGMQWAATEKHADVINLSLGGRDTPEIDPLEAAVESLTAQTGALFVIASGNDGPGRGSVDSPGSADAALTVGAVDKHDELAEFSSRGPRVGDGAVKPDITAPGVDIVAARAKNTELGPPVGEHHVRSSGTSMATPHVAGAAVLLAQQHPAWTAAELKAVLMSAAEPHAHQTAFEQGAGRVNLTKAITQTVISSTGGVSFGTARWPHDDDTPTTKHITYRNHGSSAITLSLQASLTGSDGQPAAGLTLGASSVTVPVGGTATVRVTVDTRLGGPDGAYSGRVLATTPTGQTVVTPIGGEKEVESYDLTINHLGPAGTPIAAGYTVLIRPEDSTVIRTADPDGTVEVRLPKGSYFLGTDIHMSNNLYQFIQPDLQFDKQTTITVDARNARPVRVKLPRADARPALIEVGFRVDYGEVGVRGSVSSFDYSGIYTQHLGKPMPGDDLTAYVASQWGVPDKAGEFVNSPYTYRLLNSRHGRYFDGFERTVRDSELARVTTQYNAQVDKRRATTTAAGFVPGMTSVEVPYFTYDPPSRATHYIDAGSVEWDLGFTERQPDGRDVTDLRGTGRVYRSGRSYIERWNAAVFGPAFPHDRRAFRHSGDVMDFGIPMYSDQDGHEGRSETDTASTKLYRNGELVAESDLAGVVTAEDLPSEEADFRLVTTATRPSISNFSTRTDAVWTFRSGTAAERVMLPLWAVRYRPPVDLRNLVRRRPVSVLPLTLETQPGAKPGSLARVELRVSGDDGRTWTNAAVRRTGDNRYVAVFVTPKGGHVSLKATATDSHGNSTEQAIIRAYGLR